MTEEAARVFIEAAFRGAGRPVPAVLDGRAYLLATYYAAGQPIPPWLADPAAAPAGNAAKPPTLIDALKRLWTTLVDLRGRVDGIAESKGMRFVEVETDEADERRMFAAPSSPWSTHEEAGPDQDGRARGDEGIERRRRMTELQRKLNAMTFADREGKAGEPLRKEIEALREAERLERVRKNFGTGEPSAEGQPTGA